MSLRKKIHGVVKIKCQVTALLFFCFPLHEEEGNRRRTASDVPQRSASAALNLRHGRCFANFASSFVKLNADGIESRFFLFKNPCSALLERSQFPEFPWGRSFLSGAKIIRWLLSFLKAGELNVCSGWIDHPGELCLSPPKTGGPGVSP